MNVIDCLLKYFEHDLEFISSGHGEEVYRCTRCSYETNQWSDHAGG